MRGRLATTLRIIVVGTALALGAGAPAGAQPPLLTDMSVHRISITSSFTGTELLLFGTVEEAGDIIVVARGPEPPVVVRKKERVAGIWVNGEAVTFDRVPGYYAVAASRDIREIASPLLLSRLEIGAENLRFEPRGDIGEEAAAEYKKAVIRERLRKRLYSEEVGNVRFLGKRLFHTRLKFPAVVPVGPYTVHVYLVRDQEVVAAQSSPLFVNKSGMERAIYDFAHAQPFLYGVTAIALALVAGWLASVIFRKA